MTLLKSFQKNSVGIVLALAILSRLFLINFNSAEWGDSYRILRAAQLVREGKGYPADEKRPPLFSYVLAVYPSGMDPLLFGRIVMFVVSSGSLIVFYFYIKPHIKDDKYRNLALVIFFLNPVYLYWSLRVYADVPFSLYVLFVAWLFQRWERTNNVFNNIILGFLAALSITLRFEGFILLGSVVLASFALDFDSKNIFKNVKKTLIVGFSALLVVVPYVIYRNPFQSSYLSEPSGRAYNLQTLAVFIVSLVFSLGIIIAPAILIGGYKKVFEYYQNNPFVFIFTFTSLVLILLWPAALPRLFVGAIPFMIVAFVLAFQEIAKYRFKPNIFLAISAISIIVYAVSQYLLKLQFLLVLKPSFVLVIFLNLLVGFLIWKKAFLASSVVILISLLIWSASTLWIHKDIYRSISEASIFTAKNIVGTVIYNDTNSVADWYLNYYPYKKASVVDMGLTGVFVPFKSTKELSAANLQKYHAQYVIITNENNQSFILGPENAPDLEEVKVFRYNVNGGHFFTGIYKIK